MTNSTDDVRSGASCPLCLKSVGNGALGAMVSTSNGTCYVCWSCNTRAKRSRKAKQHLHAAIKVTLGLPFDTEMRDGMCLPWKPSDLIRTNEAAKKGVVR